MLNAVEIIALVIINFIGVFIYAISSFGNAILFHVLYKIVFCTHMLDAYIPNINDICSSSNEVILVVIYVSFGSFFLFPIQTWLQRKHLNWKLALHLCMSQQLGMLFGIYVLFYVSSPWICRAMGFFFFMIALEKTYSESKYSANDSSKKIAASAASSSPPPTIESYKSINSNDADTASASIDDDGDGTKHNMTNSEAVGQSSEENFPALNPTEQSFGEEDADADETPDIGIHAFKPPEVEDDSVVKTRGRLDSVTATTYIPYIFDTWQGYSLVWFTGITSGIFAGLFATGGPPLMYFVSQIKLHSAECRATFSLYFTVQNIIRCIIILFFQNKIEVRNTKFLILFIVLTINSFIALYVGNKVAKKVDAALFRKIIICLLVFGAVFVGVAGCTPSQTSIIFVIAFIIYAAFAYFCYRRYKSLMQNNCSSSNGSALTPNGLAKKPDMSDLDFDMIQSAVISPYHSLNATEGDSDDSHLINIVGREFWKLSVYRQHTRSFKENLLKDDKHVHFVTAEMKRSIYESRGYFKSLPIVGTSDLECGSWWFVWGSLLSAVIPIVPLIDLYYPFFYVPPDTAMSAFVQKDTWYFSIFSGLMFTAGSYMYLRAFKNPPEKPLFYQYYHLSTDELAGSWLYLLAVLPSIPGAILFIYDSSSTVAIYWMYLVGALFTCLACAGMVKNSYPAKIGCQEAHEESRYAYRFLRYLFQYHLINGEHWILDHVANDWLASCWFFFFCGLGSTFFCHLFLFLQTNNDRQLFLWVAGWVDSVMFLIGSAYFVAGSYPYKAKEVKRIVRRHTHA